MKKSLVAVGVIVALGVIWTGASWYTGKQLEGRMAEMVENANRLLQKNSPDAGLTIGYQNYQRNVFSSHMDLVISPTPGVQKSLLHPGHSVVLNEDISHGPFPLAQLKTLNLLPSMASVHTKLVSNDTTKWLFEMAKGASPFDAQTRISYSGGHSSDIDIHPLNHEKEDEKVAFSGGKFTLSADGNANALSLTGQADSGLVDTVNEHGQRVQLSFNGLKTDGDSKLSSFEERIGSSNVKLDKLAIAAAGKELVVLEGFSLAAKSDVESDGKHMNGQVDYSLDAVKVQGRNMGSGKMALKIGQLDGAALHQFYQQYNAQVQALLTDPAIANNPELYQIRALEALTSNLPLLLKGGPVITVAPLSWKNDQGESTFNLSLFLKQPPTSAAVAAPQTPEQAFANNVKSVDSKLVIPIDMATGLMTQVAQLEGYEESDARKLASQQVKGLAAMGQMFRITTTDDNKILSSLQYNNGQVTLNGQKMPLADFLEMFGLTMAPAPAEPATPAVPAVPAIPAVPSQP